MRVGRRPALAAVTTLLACWAVAAPAQAAFPGRNGLVASVYDLTDRGGGVEIVLYLLDDRTGKSQAKFSQCDRSDESEPISGACPSAPAFFADGQRIAHGHGRRLAIQDVAGGKPVVLPRLTARDSDPHPSPDGSRLVFTGGNGKRTDLYTVNVDGTGLRRLTRTGASQPAWSSRGEIAFSAGGAVWRMKPGRKPKRVASGAKPEWSPSGTSIIYVSGGALYRIPARGGSSRRLVPRYAGGAGFSPDGRLIAHVQDRDPLHASLFTARSTDGARSRRLRRGGELPVGSTFVRWRTPSWQPRP